MTISRSTRSPSPHITPFPRTAIPPLRKTRYDLYNVISHTRLKSKAREARYKLDGRLDTKDPAFHRKLMCVRLMEQLCWDGPFCSTVFAEELKDRSGQRYTIADGKRNFGNEKAFETDIKLPLLHVRLEIAALERTRGEKLKERFVPLPKITKDVGCFGEYVPAKPTFPVKPPSSPVKKKAELLPKYRVRKRKESRINGIWAEMDGGKKGEEDDERMSDVLHHFQDGCAVS